METTSVFKEVLTTYWAQTVLILGGIGFLVKHGMDIKSKRKEINHFKFLEHRMNGLNAFFLSYGQLERLWDTLPIYPILNNEFKVYEVDGMIVPSINSLKSSTYALMLYLDKENYKKVDEILQNMMKIHSKLGDIYLSDGTKTLSQKASEYHLIKISIGKKNASLLEEICDTIQKDYKA